MQYKVITRSVLLYVYVTYILYVREIIRCGLLGSRTGSIEIWWRTWVPEWHSRRQNIQFPHTSPLFLSLFNINGCSKIHSATQGEAIPDSQHAQMSILNYLAWQSVDFNVKGIVWDLGKYTYLLVTRRWIPQLLNIIVRLAQRLETSANKHLALSKVSLPTSASKAH